MASQGNDPFDAFDVRLEVVSDPPSPRPRSALWQVCEAMQYMACHRAVHRDLCARNIMVFQGLDPSDSRSVRVKVGARTGWPIRQMKTFRRII